MQGQHITKSNFIVGIQLGYNDLATTTKIVGGYDLGQFISFQEGKAIFHYQYVNLHPFIGQRFSNQQMSLDLTVGIDGAIGLYSWEKGKGTTSTNLLYVTSYKHAIPRLDLRPRLGVTAYYHSVGLSLSYAYGLTNYSDNLVGISSSTANSQFWRISGIYRLSK